MCDRAGENPLRMIAGGGLGGGARRSAQEWDDLVALCDICSQAWAELARRYREEAAAARARAGFAGVPAPAVEAPVVTEPSSPAPGEPRHELVMPHVGARGQLSMFAASHDLEGVDALAGAGRQFAEQQLRQAIQAVAEQLGPLSDEEQRFLECAAPPRTEEVLASRLTLTQTLCDALLERREQDRRR